MASHAQKYLIFLIMRCLSIVWQLGGQGLSRNLGNCKKEMGWHSLDFSASTPDGALVLGEGGG